MPLVGNGVVFDSINSEILAKLVIFMNYQAEVLVIKVSKDLFLICLQVF